VASHTTLLTNLANHVQPIIRYDLGDSITVLPDRCSCSIPLPRIRVEGRRDDILTLPGQNGRSIKLAPLALETVIENAAGLQRFQLIQTDSAHLQLRLGVTEPTARRQVWRQIRERLSRYLTAQGASAVSLRLDPALPKADTRSGKLRHIVVSPSMRRLGLPRP
jgi:phenylacetate-coenzyme A ligase PaaK-like adenylate-forming protein